MLNKRKCRKFAEPGLKMLPACGPFHADQPDYIVRTSVKVISHHRTLILYVCPRAQAVQGDFRPCLTVFQDKDDFMTLSWKGDGGTAWRAAAFDNLDGSCNFKKKCAFYSAKDEERVIGYLKSGDENGMNALAGFQAGIQETRRRKRRKIRENEIMCRMKCMPSLPRGLKDWIHRSIMPAYFFYDYKRGGNDVPGVCSACGREIRLSGVKQGNKGVCPQCRRELAMKPRSRRGYCMTDRDTCQVIQGTGNGGLVIRIIKVYYTYTDDTPERSIYENSRQFVWQDADGEIRCENYYYSHNGDARTRWKRGERPMPFGKWQYHFEADICGHLYAQSLPDACKGTPWQYCPIGDFYNHFLKPVQALPFLSAYLQHPRLEHLVKTGFFSLAADLAYRCYPNYLDETQKRTHRILKVPAKDVQFLKELDADIPVLEIFQGYAGVRDRQKLLLWQMEHKVERDVLPALEHMTAHKFIRCMDSQYEFLRFRKTSYGTLRYRGMQALVSEYRDYLDICRKLGYDMKNSFVLYPKDLQKAHDRAARRMKNRRDAKMKRDFISVYRKLSGQLDFEKDGMKIVYPDTPDDVIKEGHALRHCVGGYVERVADKECVILFLRKCSEVRKPFYTIEVRGQKAAQVRGMKNSGMTPEVEAFIAAWEKSVLCARLPAGAA